MGRFGNAHNNVIKNIDKLNVYSLYEIEFKDFFIYKSPQKCFCGPNFSFLLSNYPRFVEGVYLVLWPIARLFSLSRKFTLPFAVYENSVYVSLPALDVDGHLELI